MCAIVAPGYQLQAFSKVDSYPFLQKSVFFHSRTLQIYQGIKHSFSFSSCAVGSAAVCGQFSAQHTECKAKELEVDGARRWEDLEKKNSHAIILTCQGIKHSFSFSSCAVGSAAVCGQFSAHFTHSNLHGCFP